MSDSTRTPMDAEIAWMAGIYEGEGCLVLLKRAIGSCQLTIQMCDEDVLQKVLHVAGVGRIDGPYRENIPNRKPRWCFSVSRRDDLLYLLPLLRPWLGERRRARVDEALERLSHGDRRKTNGRKRTSPCGTMAGYKWHRANNQTPCGPCREAKNTYQRKIYEPKGRRSSHLTESNVGVPVIG